MTRFVWITDLHFNFFASDEDLVQELFDEVKSFAADGLLLTGDISEAPQLAQHLAQLQAGSGLPIFYVLGNHDFYSGSISAVRGSALLRNEGLFKETYLRNQVININDTWGMIGVDGWGDGQFGRPERGVIQLNDERHIAELRQAGAHISHANRLRMVRRLGQEEAEVLTNSLIEAAKNYDKILVLTHVPPFAEASWHEGKQSEPDWLPWFTCKAVGERLLAAAQANPTKEFLVLCGHTHGKGVFKPLPNMTVRTGAAQYYRFYAEIIECNE